MSENYDDDLDSVLGFEEPTEEWDAELNEAIEDDSDESVPGLEEYRDESVDSNDEGLDSGSAKTNDTPEVDDDEIKPKGLLSTGSGRFVAIAGVVVVAVAGGGAYQMFSGGSEQVQMPVSSAPIPAQSVLSSGHESEDNQVKDRSENSVLTESVSFNDGFSLGGKKEAPVPTPQVTSPEIIPEKPNYSGVSLSLGGSKDGDLIDVNDVTQVKPVNSLSTDREAIVDFSGSAPKSGMSEDEIKSIIAEVISKELKKASDSNDSREVVSTLKLIQSKVDMLDKVMKKQSALVDSQVKEVKRISENTAQQDAQSPVEKISKRYPDHVVEGLKKGRSRIPGFKVFNSTEDGTMSVVKTPAGNVNVYFKGERFYIAGNKMVTVESVHDGGFLVLVSDGLYIDQTLVSTKVTTKPKPAKKVEVKAEKEKPAKPVVKPDSEREIVPTEDVGRLVNGRVAAPGWSLNATFGGDKSFLLTSPDGTWDTWSVGDTIKNVGIISGLDGDRNLIVGNHVILLSK